MTFKMCRKVVASGTQKCWNIIRALGVKKRLDERGHVTYYAAASIFGLPWRWTKVMILFVNWKNDETEAWEAVRNTRFDYIRETVEAVAEDAPLLVIRRRLSHAAGHECRLGAEAPPLYWRKRRAGSSRRAGLSSAAMMLVILDVVVLFRQYIIES